MKTEYHFLDDFFHWQTKVPRQQEIKKLFDEIVFLAGKDKIEKLCDEIYQEGKEVGREEEASLMQESLEAERIHKG